MRVQSKQSQPSENSQEIADTLKKLKSINETIDKKADELTLSRSKNKEEFNSRQRRHLQRMNESLDILVWFRDEERLSRANAISKYVEKSADYLLHDSDEFLEFERDWKERIENWKIESQLPLETESFLRSKGLNVRKTFVCCVYVFVQCDTVEKLDSIWEEYISENLLQEFRSTVLIRRDPQIFKIVISEENYRSYRNVFGTADNIRQAKSGTNPEDEEELAQWMPECDDCDNPAEHYCATCGDKFCTRCRDNHISSKRYRDHQVAPYSAGMRAAQKSTSTCSKHSGEPYTLYCKLCQFPVCALCIVQFHADENHTFLSIPHAFAAAKDKATSSLQKMIENIKPRVTEYSGQVENLTTDAMEAIGKCEQEMRTTANRLHEFVDHTLEDNLDKLSEVREKRIQPILEIQEMEKADLQNNVDKTIKEYEEKLRSSDPTDLLIFMRGKDSEDLEMIFAPPDIRVIPLTTFQKGDISEQTLQSYFGSLTVTDKQEVLPVTESSGKKGSTNQRQNSSTEKCTADSREKETKASSWSIMKTPSKIKEVSFKDIEGNIVNVRHCNDGKIWVALSSSNKIVLFDREGTILRSLETKCILFIGSGMCVPNDKELIFVDGYGRKLMNVSEDLNIGTLFTTGSFEPRGVCQLQNGDLVVCIPVEGLLRVYDRDGQVVRKIGQGQLTKPFYVALNSVNDDIGASDNDKEIVVFRSSGEKRLTYKGLDHTGFNPLGLCCDQLGNFLITDCKNHRVHIIDKDGRFLQYLVSGKENISHPFTIDIDEKGQTLIGEFHTKKIKTYKYLS